MTLAYISFPNHLSLPSLLATERNSRDAFMARSGIHRPIGVYFKILLSCLSIRESAFESS